MAYRPRDEDIARLMRLGWMRMGMLVPPEVRAIIVSESEWQGKSMSSLIWETIAAVYLKAHDAPGGYLPEVRGELTKDPERLEKGHQRFKAVLEMASKEKTRLYFEVQEFKEFEASVPKEKEEATNE